MQKDLLSIKPVDINVHDIVAENIELFRSGASQSEIDEVLNDDITNSTEGTASEKGSGLGMKIIKSMLDRNNGRLLVDSIKGKGSTITISLPVAS